MTTAHTIEMKRRNNNIRKFEAILIYDDYYCNAGDNVGFNLAANAKEKE